MYTEGKKCNEPPTQRPDVYGVSPSGANSPSKKKKPPTYDRGNGHNKTVKL